MANVQVAGPYDHANFQILRQSVCPAVQAPSASLTNFAHFRSRNKCLITHCIVSVTSLPSVLTTWSLYVMRGASTIATRVVSSFSVVGDLSTAIITIATEGTLTSIGNYVALRMDSTEKGKFDVTWEYKFLH